MKLTYLFQPKNENKLEKLKRDLINYNVDYKKAYEEEGKAKQIVEKTWKIFGMDFLKMFYDSNILESFEIKKIENGKTFYEIVFYFRESVFEMAELNVGLKLPGVSVSAAKNKIIKRTKKSMKKYGKIIHENKPDEEDLNYDCESEYESETRIKALTTYKMFQGENKIDEEKIKQEMEESQKQNIENKGEVND